jgi:hypothetical protein
LVPLSSGDWCAPLNELGTVEGTAVHIPPATLFFPKQLDNPQLRVAPSPFPELRIPRFPQPNRSSTFNTMQASIIASVLSVVASVAYAAPVTDPLAVSGVPLKPAFTASATVGKPLNKLVLHNPALFANLTTANRPVCPDVTQGTVWFITTELFAIMNQEEFLDGAVCGKCVEVTARDGTVVAPIVRAGGDYFRNGTIQLAGAGFPLIYNGTLQWTAASYEIVDCVAPFLGVTEDLRNAVPVIAPLEPAVVADPSADPTPVQEESPETETGANALLTANDKSIANNHIVGGDNSTNTAPTDGTAEAVQIADDKDFAGLLANEDSISNTQIDSGIDSTNNATSDTLASAIQQSDNSTLVSQNATTNAIGNTGINSGAGSDNNLNSNTTSTVDQQAQNAGFADQQGKAVAIGNDKIVTGPGSNNTIDSNVTAEVHQDASGSDGSNQEAVSEVIDNVDVSAGDGSDTVVRAGAHSSTTQTA